MTKLAVDELVAPLINTLTVGLGAADVVSNTAVGLDVLAANLAAGEYNTGVGHSALKSNTTGHSNTGVGVSSLAENTTGHYNAACGMYALGFNTTGENNTAMGTDALRVNTTGDRNTAVGLSALYENTTADDNVAVGYQALRSNEDGPQNTAVGSSTLTSNVTGGDNVAVGFSALLSATGSDNTAVGFAALSSLTTGAFNTAVGSGAGRFIADGTTPNQTSSNSVYLGRATRAGANGNTNENVIGHAAIGSGSNTTTLGNTSITRTVLRGVVEAPSLAVATTASWGPTTPQTYQAIRLANELTGNVNQTGAAWVGFFDSTGTTSGKGMSAAVSTTAQAFTMVDGYAMFIGSPSIGAGSAITNLYGLYIAAQAGGATLNYAIKTKGGRVGFEALPTAAAGLAAGDLWNNAGVLNVA